ncbi:LANO_0D07250g1_1 [Lachancea nothofagi CBS 11611]|uniref:LANO_0D07250g1_1 n=1 Tax=Lachancea nothofagi CBS 11611 TaxID=1266666 RepID=A0A1G4JHW9_9SACH|nr:LANO_0D07250g1_1 [Lachancea nothofagi CBS 11611]
MLSMRLVARSVIRKCPPLAFRAKLPVRNVATNAFAATKLKKDTWQKWMYSLGAFGALSFGIYYYYWPRHTFPNGVAKILRKALWEESDKKEHDYQSALKYYLEALDECDKLSMDPVSDEYTGIELKVAEMYERLNMDDNAHDLYLEMLYRYFDALHAPGRVPDNLRPHLIQKDLRILIKSLELNKDIQIGKRNLLAHLLLAQEEVLSRSPELKKYFEKRKERAEKLFQGKSAVQSLNFENFVTEDNIKLNEDSYMIVDMAKNSSAWEPFKEEFFTARDLYTAYCLSTKDINSALSCKLTTVEWMVMADMPPGQILLSQANLGSLLYLQAENFESKIHQLTLKREEPNGNLEDNTLIRALRQLHKNRDSCFEMASQCYESIIKFSKKNKKLRFNAKDLMDPSASQAIALSIYGMGVINLHKRNLAKAERLLHDSIAMAEETGFQELLTEAHQELRKVALAKESDSITSTTNVVE